ncbi:MAG: GNAT family N-acetyltransferase [Bacteroides sp.]|nr:GNAT family N-acetyltransferase [Bacteroides sp.]
MISFIPIKDSKHPLYTYSEKILVESFPKNEYRDLAQQKEYINSNALFSCNIIIDNDKPIGIINYWTFNHFCYIEHFAIDSTKRNQGYGKMVLEILKEKIKNPIILEVETPDTEIAIRRISFYKRVGLKLYNQPYLQPPYRREDDLLPMRIMVYGKELSDDEFSFIKRTIYKEVYNYIE